MVVSWLYMRLARLSMRLSDGRITYGFVSLWRLSNLLKFKSIWGISHAMEEALGPKLIEGAINVLVELAQVGWEEAARSLLP